MIGQKVTLNGEEWTVEATSPWSDQYVYLTKPSEPCRCVYPDKCFCSQKTDLICRRAGDVRRAIELERSQQ